MSEVAREALKRWEQLKARAERSCPAMLVVSWALVPGPYSAMRHVQCTMRKHKRSVRHRVVDYNGNVERRYR